MGRVYSEIKTHDLALWTLFDTGARLNYVTRNAAARGLTIQRLSEPRHVAIGGAHRALDEYCVVEGALEGKQILLDMHVIDDLGADASGRPIDALFGAVEMQRWSIRPIPDEERLDLSRFPDEFIEY